MCINRLDNFKFLDRDLSPRLSSTIVAASLFSCFSRSTAMPAMEPVGFPQMGVGLQGGLQGGLQLVRDPTSGHLLLIHAAGEYRAEKLKKITLCDQFVEMSR